MIAIGSRTIKPIRQEETRIKNLIYRLRTRSEIRKQISSRKSVQEGKPDRLAELLDESANELESLIATLNQYRDLDASLCK